MGHGREYEHGKKINLEKLSHKSRKDRNNKTRRGNNKRKGSKHKNNNKSLNFSLLGTNSNGITNKLESLKHNIDIFKPTVVTIQETKARKLGSVKLEGYQIFEKIRITGGGGGLLTAVDQNINPVLISTGKDEDTEIITVQAKVGRHNIRIINAYGPQEDEENQVVLKFWQELEEEIVNAKDDNCLVIVELDANAKIGKENIKNDPNNITANGKLLMDVAERNNLCIANTSKSCKGVITRERKFEQRVEKSVIDYVIVCDDMKEYLEEMLVDEDRTYALTKYAGKSGSKRRVISDHNILFSKFSIKYNCLPVKVRKEFFQLKSKESQEAFKKVTSETKKLSSCFVKSRTFPHNANIFFHKLNSCLHQCFRKVRVRVGGRKSEKQSLIQEYMKLRTHLKLLLLQNNITKSEKIAAEKTLHDVESFLTDNCAAKNAATVREYIGEMKTEEGSFSQLKIWKLKQKLCPNVIDPPMAKKNEDGSLITAPELLKSLYLRTYQKRLENRIMKKELMDVYFLKEELWKSRMIELRRKKTEPWDKKKLKEALKTLKNNKTMDPNGMVNELFKDGCAGEDLEEALLELFNGIKDTFHIPEFLVKENICSIFKKKGSRLNMNNERGIFILTAMKKILDKLIYIEKNYDVDKNMSDSNIGARKGRNMKNHLFIIYRIINSVVKYMIL